MICFFKNNNIIKEMVEEFQYSMEILKYIKHLKNTNVYDTVKVSRILSIHWTRYFDYRLYFLWLLGYRVVIIRYKKKEHKFNRFDRLIIKKSDLNKLLKMRKMEIKIFKIDYKLCSFIGFTNKKEEIE